MRNAIISDCVLAGAIYIGLRMPFIGPQWYARNRQPQGTLLKLPLLRRWAESPAPARIARARVLLARPGNAPSGDLEASWGRLETLVRTREFATTCVVMSWMPPGLLALAAWFTLLIGDPPGAHWTTTVGIWLVTAAAIGFGTYDWRRYEESEPTQHTVHLALYALDACHGPAPDFAGGQDPDVIAPAIEAFCAALARQAEYVPKTSDPELRNQARTDAELVIKNVQAAKIRFLRNDATALNELSRILASVVTHAVKAPSSPPDMRVADEALLSSDPGWNGPIPRPAFAVRTVASYALFTAYLTAIALLVNWVDFPEPVSAILIPVLALPGLKALQRHRSPTANTAPDGAPTASTTDSAGPS